MSADQDGDGGPDSTACASHDDGSAGRFPFDSHRLLVKMDMSFPSGIIAKSNRFRLCCRVQRYDTSRPALELDVHKSHAFKLRLERFRGRKRAHRVGKIRIGRSVPGNYSAK